METCARALSAKLDEATRKAALREQSLGDALNLLPMVLDDLLRSGELTAQHLVNVCLQVAIEA